MFGDAFKKDDELQNETNQEKEPDNSDEEMQENEEEQPLLFVDVNLGPNDQRRIVVFEGDQPRQLAEQFCVENDLD